MNPRGLDRSSLISSWFEIDAIEGLDQPTFAIFQMDDHIAGTSSRSKRTDRERTVDASKFVAKWVGDHETSDDGGKTGLGLHVSFLTL